MNCKLFFFSSRRRHTRWPRDWSSDVCSSDLFMEDELLEAKNAIAKLGGKFEIKHSFQLPIEQSERTILVTKKVKKTPKARSEEHTSELQSRGHLVCRLLLEKKNKQTNGHNKRK